jgi:hypothetical protein
MNRIVRVEEPSLSIHFYLVLNASTEGPIVLGVGSPQQTINLSTTLLSFSRMQDARYKYLRGLEHDYKPSLDRVRAESN